MLKKVTKNEIKAIYELGTKYDSKFRNKYNLVAYLDSEIYVMNYIQEDKNIVGFIICTLIKKKAEVLLIYVDDRYRGRGYGKELLKSVEKGADEILLEVSKDNNIAYNLYKGAGYEAISIRPKYYNGVDALVMKKVLK